MRLHTLPAASLLALLAAIAAPEPMAQQPTPPATTQTPPAITQAPPDKRPRFVTLSDGAPLPSTPSHQPNFDAETQQANQLFTSGRQLEALPLYADLCRQDPTVALFAERHGATLFARYASPATDAKLQADAFVQGLAELYRAQSLGDNSHDLRALLTVAEKTPLGAIMTGIPLTVGYTYMGNPAAQAVMARAEAIFSQQPAEAGKLYAEAAVEDPAFYTAALYAGDAAYRTKDYAQTGVWYAKAIAIDPDRETAYRYWADAVFHQGEPLKARPLVVKAFLAEPYSVATWAEMRGWANTTHSSLTIPPVNRQEYRNPDNTILLDASKIPEDGSGRSAWIVYQQVRAAHGARSLTQNLPPAGAILANGEFSASGYIHTLAEETEALNAALADIDKKLAAGTLTEDKLDLAFKTLLKLRKDNMIECFVLLNASDLGLRHDYAKYRAGHRELLAAYVDKYLLPTQRYPGSPANPSGNAPGM